MPLKIDSLKDKKKKENFLIEEKDGGYIYTKYDSKGNPTKVKVSDFTLTVKDIIQILEKQDVTRKLVVEINHKGQKDVGTFEPKDICDIASFKKAIRSRNPSCGFYKLDNNSLEELIRYIQPTNIAYTNQISKAGFIEEHNCFTFNNGIIYNQKFYPYNDLNVSDLGDKKLKLQEYTKYLPNYINDNEYNPDIKYKLPEHMNHMFCGIQGELVIGFMIASLFLNSCKSQLKPFPLLFVSGRRASGKTIAISHAMQMFGLENVAGASEQDSEFVDSFSMNHISSLPYWSDEYKNQKRSSEKQSFYKTVFDRNGVSKGNVGNQKNPNLGVNTMDVNASLILSGEQTPSDDAVFSRICLIDINGERQGDLYSEIKKDSFSYSSLIRNILEEYNFDKLVEEFKTKLIRSENILKKQGLEKRILNVYNPIIAGYMLFVEDILGKEIHSSFFNKVAEHAENKNEENEHDIVEEFFEKVNYKLSSKPYVDASEHIRYNANNNTINFNFAFLYGLYSENNYNCIPKSNLKKYIKSKYNPKDSSMSKTGKGGGVYGHTMMFDVDNMPYSLKEYIDEPGSDIPF